MSKLDIFAVGHCENDGLPTRLAGCGIILIYTDDHNRVIRRALSFALNNSSEELANIQAVRLALATVKPAGRSGLTTVSVRSAKTVQQLTKVDGEYSVEPAYQDQLAEVRGWLDRYRDILVHVGVAAGDLERAAELGRVAAMMQKNSDSGSLMP